MSPPTRYSDSGPRAKLIELKLDMPKKEVMELIWRRPDEEQIIFLGNSPHLPDFIDAAQKINYKIITLVTDGAVFEDSKFLVDVVISGATDIQIKINELTNEKINTLKKILELGEKTPAFFKPSLSVGIYVSQKNKDNLTGFLEVLENINAPEVFLINSEKLTNFDLTFLVKKTKMKIFTIGFGDKFDYHKFCKENPVIKMS